MRGKISKSYIFNRNKWLFIGFCFFIGIVLAIFIYRLLDLSRDSDNGIITLDMLMALKDYDVINVNLIKTKFICRILLFGFAIMLCVLQKYRLIKMLLMFMCIKMGFVFMIFVLEMKLIGAANYIFIVSPDEIVYVISLATLLFNIDSLKYNAKVINFKIYMSSLLLWLVGIFYETIIKVVFVRKILIIPKGK